MTDLKDNDGGDLKFDSALLQAIAAAGQLEAAQTDLRNEVAAFASAIKHATQNKLTATINAGRRRTPLGVIASFTVVMDYSDPEDNPAEAQSVLMIANREGRVPWEQTREVCRIIASENGYPFRVEGPQGTIFAEDKDGLHVALYEASRHARTGSKIKGLLQQLQTDPSEGTPG